MNWLGKVFKPRYRIVLEHDGFWSAERWDFPFGWSFVSQTLRSTRSATEERLSLVRSGKYKEIHDVK